MESIGRKLNRSDFIPLVKWYWILFTLSLLSCEKYQKQILVQTGSLESVSYTTASISGEIVDVGEGIARYGHCWAIAPELPTCDLETISEFHSTDGPIQYTSSLPNLLPDEEYVVRAYAIDHNDKAHYAPENLSVQTLAQTAPVVETLSVKYFNSNTVTCGGNIIADGGGEIYACGVCWSENPNPTTNDLISQSSTCALGEFTVKISGLNAGTKYYFRALVISKDVYENNLYGYGDDEEYP